MLLKIVYLPLLQGFRSCLFGLLHKPSHPTIPPQSQTRTNKLTWTQWDLTGIQAFNLLCVLMGASRPLMVVLIQGRSRLTSVKTPGEPLLDGLLPSLLLQLLPQPFPQDVTPASTQWPPPHGHTRGLPESPWIIHTYPHTYTRTHQTHTHAHGNWIHSITEYRTLHKTEMSTICIKTVE